MIRLSRKRMVIGLDNTLTAMLSEIGLSQDEIAVADRLNRCGKTDDLQKYLRLCRCGLIDEMHHTQKKVDQMDFLIRQLKGGALS